jgi:hypothetical protein
LGLSLGGLDGGLLSFRAGREREGRGSTRSSGWNRARGERRGRNEHVSTSILAVVDSLTGPLRFVRKQVDDLE